MKQTLILPPPLTAVARFLGSYRDKLRSTRVPAKSRLIQLFGPVFLALLALPAQAQIAVVNTATERLQDQAGEFQFENNPYVVQFDATGADKLIVTLSSETGGSGTPVITYADKALTKIPSTSSGRNHGIWYLDLAGTGYAGGNADLSINMTAFTTVNGIGYAAVAISGSADGAAVGNLETGTSVTLNAPVADSYVVTNYGANGSVSVTAPSGHNALYFGDIGSARGGASYANGVAAGPQTITWDGTVSAGDEPRTSAAVFVPASALPVIVSTSPADNAVNVPVETGLVARFSEPVVANTGFVTLKLASDNSTVESFDVTSGVTISGQELTINPTNDLALGSEYYVTIDAGAVKDLTGNAFAGIADTTTWNFTTATSATADGTYISQTGAWNVAGSWQDANIASGPDRSAFFTNDVITSARTTSLGEDRTIGQIVFTDADNTTGFNRTISGNILTFDVTSGRSAIDVTQSNRQLIFDSRISGSDGLKLIGPGLVRFNNTSNDYSGGTEINAGTLWLPASGTAGSGTIFLGDTSGSANAELRMSTSGTNIGNAMEVRAGSSGTKTLANRSTNSVNYSGTITVNDNLSVPLAGATGGGVFSVSGAGNSIATGKTVSFAITGGGTGRINDSALWSGDGSISYTSDSAKGFTVSGAKTYSGGATLAAMSGTGALVVQTSSTGPANAPASGPFGTGILNIGATKMRGDTAAAITIGNAITFSDNPTFTTVASEQSLIFTGDASLGATRTLTVETGSTVADTFVEFSGDISGTGFGITKEGAGNLLLSGTNTYTGDTTVNAGVLALTGNSIVNTAKLVINGIGKVDLTGTETVAALDFDATPQPDGDYSASSVPPGATITIASFSGTGTLTVGTPSDPFIAWSGGAAFNADSNNDGVKNGLAWLLGAPDKDTNALDRLPKVSQNGGGLVMKFTCLKLASRGTSTLTLQHSGDLGHNDPWFSVAVPDTATTVGNVVFTVPTTNANPNLVDLEATIPVTEALNGKFFGRLHAENP